MAKVDRVRIIDQPVAEVSATYTGALLSSPGSANIKHNLLQHRAYPDQHPISAITNLIYELSIRVKGAPDGVAGKLPVFSDIETIINSIVTQVEDRIGIGRDDPGYTLDVAGWLRSTGIVLGQLSDGPYVSESNGSLSINNPAYSTMLGGLATHIEGLSSVAITAWQDSIVIELTDRNTANTFSVRMLILEDGFYFLSDDVLLAHLSLEGVLYLQDPVVRPLSSFRSSIYERFLETQNAKT